ncbi:hypothetical protein Taro_047215 [Colocasia esculenta]|uniref:Cytochrome b561 and DOMON domain-containing protein n=1 Tax=Colocasia esculenta TaxID=4460 RepID=A0A843X6G2_COLES|nr:hypothetical protein [Colocasia esculenta]
MKVSFLAAILFSHLLSGFNGAAGANYTNSTCPTNLIVDTNTLRFPFNTSNFLCSSVWSYQNFILMYQQTSASVWSFVLSAPNNYAYIAIGFSNNGKMVGSSAIVGWLTNAGAGVAKQYYLGGKNPGQCPPDQGFLQLAQAPIIMLQSWRLYLGFQLNTTQPPSQLIYALGPQYQVPGSDNYLFQHQDRVSTSIDYVTGQISTSNGGWSALQTAHGAVSLAGWGVLLPIGMLVARYFKGWEPAWFYAHASIQTLAFGLGIAGVVTGFLLENDVSKNVSAHKGLGIGILALAALQVTALLLRPKKESKHRKYWNWYHHNAGRLALAGAITNIFYGLSLVGQDTTPWFIGYGCYLGVIVLVFLGLEIMKLVPNAACGSLFFIGPERIRPTLE